MNSHNLSKIQIGDLSILGYSVAGEETVVGIPQLDVCFDVGKAPEQLISVNHVLLTHGHEDHIGALSHLLRDFDVPVYGTPLTLALARSRLQENNVLDRADLRP